MEVIVRRQDHPRCASITCMIRHYVARRAQVIEDHPHNADVSMVFNRIETAGQQNQARQLSGRGHGFMLA
jgi:hypothetical protein